MARDNGGIIGVTNNPTSSTATGVWSIESQYQARVGDTWPEKALFTTKSARFNDGSSDYLTRTPSSASNRKTWTWSGWIKLGVLGTDRNLFGAYANANDNLKINIADTDTVSIRFYNGSEFQLGLNRVFRDTSAWYHLVFAVDTTLTTAADRFKIYVNGVRETSFAADAQPTQDLQMTINNTTATQIGRFNTSAYFDGYMAESILVDGQQLAPTSFGVANSDGVWTPIIYTGTFGTNGFNLQFEDAAALGTDSSPNGNTFTVNNLTSIDQSTDYPEVNFATLNPLARRFSSTPNTFSDGNLTSAFPAAGNSWNPVSATFGMTNGKWYWESKSISGASTYNGIMAQEPTTNTGDVWLGGIANQFGYSGGNGYVYVANSNQASLSSYTNGDTVSVAYDADNNLIYFYKNGAIQNSGTGLAVPTPESTPLGAWFPAWSTWDTAAIVKSFNFGSPPYAISSGNADGNGYGNFEYAVPSGYYSLNTKNLAEFG